jgi:hypothetical protein
MLHSLHRDQFLGIANIILSPAILLPQNHFDVYIQWKIIAWNNGCPIAAILHCIAMLGQAGTEESSLLTALTAIKLL